MSPPTRHRPKNGSQRKNQDPLYDTNIPTPTHAERARTLVTHVSTGALATLSNDLPGYPHGSLVTYALHNSNPVFLVSELATHTRNLKSSPKASLMVSEAGEGNPLALGRVTLTGDCTPVAAANREQVKATFLEQHPSAKFYADFEDFSFYELSILNIRYIGGFGRMSWIEPDLWGEAQPDPLAPHAETIIEHMNTDHPDSLSLFCTTMSRASTTREATLVGVDRYGFEMSALTDDGPRPIRLAFSKAVATPEEVRAEMISLVHKAREL